MRLAYLLVAPALVTIGLAVTPTAAADCTTSGNTTLCSQGTSRGSNSGSGPGTSGPYVPYPCDINWYDCNDYWDVNLDVDLDPGRPGIGGPGGPPAPDIGLPGRPGGGGGFGGGGRGGGRR
ncbi:hypothetical protein C6A85_000000111295 [Mycobacterium sp. ITM-2017-0098]|nr:hypothetical protein C6A85_000000111295 [Mycobacterium sp. ITM-2017-0098]